MDGQRVIFLESKPIGTLAYHKDLKGTKGTVFEFIKTGGALIRCDIDGEIWAFAPTQFKFLKETKQ